MLTKSYYANVPPEEGALNKFFHSLFRLQPPSNSSNPESKDRKKNSKSKSKKKTRMELVGDTDWLPPPEMSVLPNASTFAVFAAVRAGTFERWMRQANMEYLSSSNSVPVPIPEDCERQYPLSEDSDEPRYDPWEPSPSTPAVCLGLESVFELIKETRNTHPALCTKALTALFKVLQGQEPEYLKSENAKVINSIFEILQDLSTLHGPESWVPNDGSHLTALACASLLSLVVARGDTGKFLSATASLIMCPRVMQLQNIKMPGILAQLQKSVQSVFLGTAMKSDYFLYGVPESARMLTFAALMPSGLDISSLQFKSMTCDGLFLYLFSNQGLLKIGTGYGGTIRGHTYVYKADFYPKDNGTILWCDGKLYLKLDGRRGCEFLIVDRDSLLISGSVPLHSKDAASNVVCSNGEWLATIIPGKEDGFVVRILNKDTIPASVEREIPMDVARKVMEMYGTAPYEEAGKAQQYAQIKIDEDVASVHAGKEFALLRTTSGKVYYSGKASALGLKQSTNVRPGRWKLLLLPKHMTIVEVAMGHDGLHAILVSQEKHAFFVGTARRGEDGELSKIRRQPKPSKVKRMSGAQYVYVASAACNSGTTALVESYTGGVVLFGKDATHIHESGHLKHLAGESAVQIALGKAHGAIVCKSGAVYTFGVNNKFQCGRDYIPPSREESFAEFPETVIAMDTCGVQDDPDIYDDPYDGKEDVQNQVTGSTEGNDPNPNGGLFRRHQICLQHMHSWHFDRCMICTVCKQCTGYSSSCQSSSQPGRVPGTECGCGDGCAGCAICGCCKECSQLQSVDNNVDGQVNEAAGSNHAMRLDLMYREKIGELLLPRQRTKLQEQLKSRLVEAQNRRKNLSGKQILKGKSSKSQTSLSGLPMQCSPMQPVSRQLNGLGGKDHTGSDVERESARAASLPPAKIYVPDDSPAVQVACGMHHTVILLQNGQVYTFGSNQYGQLGCGDIIAKPSIQHVQLPCYAVQVAAGSNHTIVLTSKGEVYTFGAYQKGQLGRPEPTRDASQPSGSNQSKTYRSPWWYAAPGLIPNIGPRSGRRATWISGSGDQTFIKLNECLLSPAGLLRSTVMAYQNTIVITPKQEEEDRFRCLVSHNFDGECVSFKGNDQANFVNKLVCLDRIYNVLWSYDPTNNLLSIYKIAARELFQKYSIQAADGKTLTDVFTVTSVDENDLNVKIPLILSPDLALPVVPNCTVTRVQAAVNLLCCLDTLTVDKRLQVKCKKDNEIVTGVNYYLGHGEYNVVNRFESNGGGWGYSNQSIEAIRFMADTDIILGGVGLFGGRGEYHARMRLYDLGLEGGDDVEVEGDLIAEVDQTPYDCLPRQKFNLMFYNPVQLRAYRWYTAWCQINGPSSDCGAQGQSSVSTEDQVTFYFKSTKISNNGTDVNAGQIPQLLYKVTTPEIRAPKKKAFGESIKILSREFSRTVTVECFHSLQTLLQWAWNTFKRGVTEGPQQPYTIIELERLVYVCRASLRLLRGYILEIYPNRIEPTKKRGVENIDLAACIAEVRTLIRQILSDNLPNLLQNKKSYKGKSKCEYSVTLMNSILDECHCTFVTCFHVFYPTGYLKWNSLCDTLYNIEQESKTSSNKNSQRLLSAVLRSLSGPTIRLRSTLPLLKSNINIDTILQKELGNTDNTNTPGMPTKEVHYYPVLVEQMTSKTKKETTMTENMTWKDVFDRLMNLLTEPIRRELNGHRVIALPSLTKHCCHFLARVVAELVSQYSANEDDMFNAYGQCLHATPSRFTKINRSRSWNPANVSPEAIYVQVDRPGISIAGIGVYGGTGYYDYDLEILEDRNLCGGVDGDSERWHMVHSCNGRYGGQTNNAEIIEIRFNNAVPIRENMKYAIRWKNNGGMTNNGDNGLSCVMGPDHTMFIFSNCPLSYNGTTVTRGQIPVILYYSNPMETAEATSASMGQEARTSAISMTRLIVERTCQLLALAREKVDEVPAIDIINNTYVVKTLLPMVMAHISSMGTTNPRCAVEILNIIQEILPHVAALNLISGSDNTSSTLSSNLDLEALANTTSQHYACVQSDHPYKPATVSNYRVKFPENVKWVVLEFDPNCSLIQAEDTLQLYIPSLDAHTKAEDSWSDEDSKDNSPIAAYWPVLQRFTYNNNWPVNAVIIPGNEVVFSLETSTNYLKDDNANAFGFRCTVIGYEWPSPCLSTKLKDLEAELAYLGGICSASMIKKDLLLPRILGQSYDPDIEEAAEVIAERTMAKHGSLLSKGLALSSAPTIMQALDGTLPYNVHSNERMFLRDFVNCVEGTSGGRLAQWLQPGSRVDPAKSQVIFSKEDLRRGWPTIITIWTCDQYTEVVNVVHVNVEVKAIPIDKKDLGDSDAARKIRRVSQPDPLTFGGLPPPVLSHPYEPTVRDKMCFHSITAMKPYQNYSFEEMRYISPPVRRSSENMLVRPNGDGTYTATWTPASIGCYSVIVNIDGYEMEEVFKVEVREPPQGLTPPMKNSTKKPAQKPKVRFRKFVGKNSAGLRIRALPSLQSEQLAIVHVNGTIAFIDEVHNDDGVWLRLSAETIKQYRCRVSEEAWCLQYNQHTRKTLLLPVEESKAVLHQVITQGLPRPQAEAVENRYQVVKSGASGHNVRTGPSLEAPSVGVLVLGSIIGVQDYVVNEDGCWVSLDEATKRRYCFNPDFDAWSLAIGENNKMYLAAPGNHEQDFSPKLPPDADLKKIFSCRGLNNSVGENPFASALNPPISAAPAPLPELLSTNPFVFGGDSGDPTSVPAPPRVPKRERKDSKPMGLPKWFKEEIRSVETEYTGISVKELVKAIGESRANGNGVTPPGTPKRSASPRAARYSSRQASRSSSPIAVPPGRNILLHESASSSPQQFSPRSIGISPLVSGTGGHESSARRGSNQSDTSALVSSITRDLSQSPSQATHPRDLSPSPSGSSMYTRSETSPLKPNVGEQSPRALAQTGTQTSPENSSSTGDPSVKGQFSIGTVHKEESTSPKLSRKERPAGSKSRPKRAISPTKGAPVANGSKVSYPTAQPVKKAAMSPSLAEALRAIFAAFLWHEGIVHDAMACASYLKFHPTLSKQGTRVVTRHGPSDSPVDKRRQELTKEERARQRHSVEVATAGNYLHIQPSTLESLTRSAANASANRSRGRRVDPLIKEDSQPEASYVSVLPPALKCLVYLWEQLMVNSLHTMAMAKDVYLSTAASLPISLSVLEKRLQSVASKPITIPKQTQRYSCDRRLISDEVREQKKRLDSIVSYCELCGSRGLDPITRHMKQSHPGCGMPASGRGYGPDGIYYVEELAGNCGTSGVNLLVPYEWYLFCERCRNKHLSERKVSSVLNKKQSKSKEKANVPNSLMPVTSDFSRPHMIMRNNAMFLLELASAAETNVNRHQRRPSSCVMPSLSENGSPPDNGSLFGVLPPFQCLQALGADSDYKEYDMYEEVLRRQDGSLASTSGIGQRPLSEVSLSDDADSTKSMRFHRSISMGTNGVPWSKTGLDGRVIMTRKRNNTTTELPNENMSSLLCKPSPALLKLVPNMDGSPFVNFNPEAEYQLNTQDVQDVNDQSNSSLYLLQRPVMDFIMIPQDLESLQIAMRQAVRKATCRVYAMQALNWLLRSVTQPVCLHDLLWWFVASLHSIDNDEPGDDNKPKKPDEQICEHPLSDIVMAGDSVHPLPSTFHTLLQTIADLMVLLPMGSALQQMAMRCWGIKFTPADHTFLHRSQVFSNISKVLSRSEEIENTAISMHESAAATQIQHTVEQLIDISGSVEIKASTRQAMVVNMTDGSTETFWESGEEDRYKNKRLTITCEPGHVPKLVCVHIDNVRDLNHKVTGIYLYGGPNPEELVELQPTDIDINAVGGWIQCPITDPSHTVIELELRGDEHAIRVRQICVLGEVEGRVNRLGKQSNAVTVQQKNCEAETLRVFRLITSQVFGKLILGEQEGQHNLDSGSVSASESLDPLEESNDLREHMVGILFSRSKLTHLQKQVIVHIVYAIKKETVRAREEWESMLTSTTGDSASSELSQEPSKSSDTYCFEMLSMVLALSGSAVGRAYLSQQGGLLADLLSLLHIGSARVQRQVTSLLRRMLPEITPEALAAVMHIDSLPPKDISIVASSQKESNNAHFDTTRIGILDVFLSIIAKSLTLQVKMKGKGANGSTGKEINTVTMATCIRTRDVIGDRWWLRGTITRKLSEVIMHLIADMASGKLSEAWGNVTKAAIAQNILNFTQLSDEQRNPSTCLQTPTLWMTLASLCVLDKDHVDRLSSGQWRQADGQQAPPGPTCTNHDDGETNAIVQCSVCGNLCADCDRFLHLHRKTKHHQRQVCKEEEEAIKVDLHEGCGRLKLFWLLALADARTLKALIEYREGGPTHRAIGTCGQCRFCGAVGTSGLLAIGNVCADQECQDYALSACSKVLPCGHMCGGVQGEMRCLPCLHGCSPDPTLRQDADDMCMICFTEALSCAPAIQLQCGHVFHSHCSKTALTKRWVGPRITFSFSLCPICKNNMEHPTLTELLAPIQSLFADVKKKARMRLEYEGLHVSEPIVTPGGRFYNDPDAYAMDRYAYYVCFKCNKAYYGGEARCDAEIGENYNPAELVCGACSDVTQASICSRHGTDYLEYKCRYCCTIAVFFCFGTTHFCNPCHDNFQKVTGATKDELPHCPAGPRLTQLEGDECPLRVPHPPTGEEYAIGCGICRNASSF